MKGKEDELNSIVMELRKNLKALQEKFAKEEVDKLVWWTKLYCLNINLVMPCQCVNTDKTCRRHWML